jgi:hypothetical protein
MNRFRMAPLRVAAIGRTGRGDWGHAIDQLWGGVEGAALVAVADESEDALAKAVERNKLDASRPGVVHRDWKVMLTEAKPDIVAICMRHIDCHAEMAIAAAEAGVKGIFMEKPFVRTLAENELERADDDGLARAGLARDRRETRRKRPRQLFDEREVADAERGEGGGHARDYGNLRAHFNPRGGKTRVARTRSGAGASGTHAIRQAKTPALRDPSTRSG